MIKTILVPICHEQGAEERIECAISMANTFDAHVKALHILTPLENMTSAIHHDFTSSIELYSQFQQEAEAEADKLREKFEQKLINSGVRFDWCQEKGNLLTYLYTYSRASDIAIVSQRGESYDDILNYVNDFIIDSGLPVLAIPRNANNDVAPKNILVAWDGSKESAKATHDALPFLKNADKVTVLTISDDKKEDLPEADICIHLARHDVNAEALTLTNQASVAKCIMETATNVNADMIVAGAWGHKRLQELIFGGATRTLISNQKLPVLFAH